MNDQPTNPRLGRLGGGCRAGERVDRSWRRGLGGLLILLWGLGAGISVRGAIDTNRTGRGYSYVHDVDPRIPWSIHVVKVQRGHPAIELQTTVGRGGMFGRSTVSEQAKGVPVESGTAVAAINGDFYHNSNRYPGRPRDLQVLRGEMVSAPSGHACFWLDPDGTPRMTNLLSRVRVIWPDGVATPVGLNENRDAGEAVLYTSVVGPSTRCRGGKELVLERGTNAAWLPLAPGLIYSARVREVREASDTRLTPDTLVLSLGPNLSVPQLADVRPGTLVSVSTETYPNLVGVKTAIGGGPTLVRDGRAMEWPTNVVTRHPRSAVGWNKDTVFLVEVDGRQGDISLGMTFTELAGYMVKLGCTDAMNLDGGGSSTLWVYGNVMNSPSEGRERPAPNALVVVEKRARRDENGGGRSP